VCVSDKEASKGDEENGEIYGSLLQSFLLLPTVVPAVCNRGERMLPTVRVQSEAANRELGDERVEPNDP